MSALDDKTKDELYLLLEKYDNDTTGFKRQVLLAIKYKEIDEYKKSCFEEYCGACNKIKSNCINDPHSNLSNPSFVCLDCMR